MSVLTPAHDDIFDLLGDSTGPKHESREEPGIDLSLDLLNIDFTNSDLMTGPQASTAKPAPVIKSDDPLTNDILSLYNLPAKKEPVVQPKSEEGKNSISNHNNLDDKFFISLGGAPVPKEQDAAIDDLFGDFGSGSKTQAKDDDETEKQALINEKREIMELISFKINLVFLEKALIVLKNNQLSEGKCMGHIGLEFGGVIEKEDGENVILTSDFSDVQSIWNNPQKIMKNANPQVKVNNSEINGPNMYAYNVNDFKENVLLYEYQLNPKEIKLVPLSIQYRTALIDGLLKVKIFCHANPKLPKKLFDIEVHVFLKEKDKLTLKNSEPHGIQTKEKIAFNLPGMEPDQ